MSHSTPTLRVSADRVVISRTDALTDEYDDVVAPLLELGFVYDGTRVRAADDARVFHSSADGMVPLDRDMAAESRARHLLERLGAVELACFDDVAPPPDSTADYVVRLDGGAHGFCAFTAQALPKLRALGWQIDIDADYPFRVTDEAAPWFASVAPDEAHPGWFSLELGIEVDGHAVDLLPLVVELLGDAHEAEGLRALERRFRATYALRASDTSHVTVSRDRLRALLHVVIELYQGGAAKRGPTIAFPEIRAAALARLDAAFAREGTPLKWRDPAKLVERARSFTESPAPVKTPDTVRAELRPYQLEGVAFLQHLREREAGGILADDMGLGKTLQTIAHICIEKAAGRLELPALVVGPTSLVGNWTRELARFAPHLKVTVLHGSARHTRWDDARTSDVVVTTYPIVVRDEERFAKEQYHLLVLDEAQAIKNTRSLAHRAMASIHAEHRVCLTGTPVENHLGELWALFDFLNPGLLGDELAFRRWYRQPIEERQDEERLLALRGQVAPYVLRRVKRDVARELPPKTELFRPIELRGKQRDLYEHIRVAAHADVRKVIRAKGLAASTIPILGALMKLRQVCCDPRLVGMDAARGVRTSAKYETLFEILEAQLAEGHRALVFSQFTSMLALIAEGLKERGLGYLALTGSTRDRQGVVDAFEAKRADVFLISLKAGGTGLNLVSADTVIHYDPWWNPASQAQATDRAYRIGQERPVFVYNLYAAGSVEERVMRLQQRKRWLASTLLGDGDQAKGLDERDVETLFAPLEGEGERGD